jgi:hypothetical protein
VQPGLEGVSPLQYITPGALIFFVGFSLLYAAYISETVRYLLKWATLVGIAIVSFLAPLIILHDGIMPYAYRHDWVDSEVSDEALIVGFVAVLLYALYVYFGTPRQRVVRLALAIMAFLAYQASPGARWIGACILIATFASLYYRRP